MKVIIVEDESGTTGTELANSKRAQPDGDCRHFDDGLDVLKFLQHNRRRHFLDINIPSLDGVLLA